MTGRDRLREIVKRTANMGSCSQMHHEHLAYDARAVLADPDGVRDLAAIVHDDIANGRTDDEIVRHILAARESA